MTQRPTARCALILVFSAALALVSWAAWAFSTRREEPVWRAPDIANIRYGPHPRNMLDLWKAKPSSATDRDTPVVVFFHGGGFRSGDKASIPTWLVVRCLEAGISVASVNYRLAPADPFPAPMFDGARAIQFLRFKAKQFDLDPARIAAAGSSAGGGIALWVGFHDDLANSESPDPVSRQSSRVSCLGGDGAQTSYDPLFIKALIGAPAAEHPALRLFYGMPYDADLDTPTAHRLYDAASPGCHVSAGDPPVILFYDEPDAPLPPDAKLGDGIHHPRFGRVLKAKLDPLGIECVLRHRSDYPRRVDRNFVFYRDMAAFFKEKLHAGGGNAQCALPDNSPGS
jgi:acetyl esterase/lipase